MLYQFLIFSLAGVMLMRRIRYQHYKMQIRQAFHQSISQELLSKSRIFSQRCFVRETPINTF